MSEEINKGQLMENEQKALQSHHSQEKSDETNSEKSERKFPVVHEHRCNYCGKMTSKSPCEHCGDVQQITTDKKEGGAIKVDDKKPKKERLKIFIIVTVAVVLLGSISVVAIYNFVNQYSDSSYDETEYEDYDESDNSDGEHITEVPEGYIGIYTAEDFDYFISSPEQNYILMNDIDMSNYDSHHKNIGDEFLNIKGDFDGNNYCLKNFTSDDCLFEELSDYGYIHDLSVDNFHINNSSAILIGRVDTKEEDSVAIENTHISNSSISCTASLDSGTLAGYCRYGKIINCSFKGKISINEHEKGESNELNVGGIASSGNCQYCYTAGSITVNNSSCAQVNIGGIIGKGFAFRCQNTININALNAAWSYVGGIVGSSKYNIEQCCNSGKIVANDNGSYVGGISGEAYQVTNCYNRGDICGRIVGGLSGDYVCELTKSYNIGKIQKYNDPSKVNHLDSHGGALYGWNEYDNESSIADCYYTNDMSATGDKNLRFPLVKKITLAEAQNEETFSGFDFYEIWTMGDSDYPYPILQGIDYSN